MVFELGDWGWSQVKGYVHVLCSRLRSSEGPIQNKPQHDWTGPWRRGGCITHQVSANAAMGFGLTVSRAHSSGFVQDV